MPARKKPFNKPHAHLRRKFPHIHSSSKNEKKGNPHTYLSLWSSHFSSNNWSISDRLRIGTRALFFAQSHCQPIDFVSSTWAELSVGIKWNEKKKFNKRKKNLQSRKIEKYQQKKLFYFCVTNAKKLHRQCTKASCRAWLLLLCSIRKE